MDEKAGTFLVTAADDATAELAAVDDGQVIALASNPGLESGDVVEGTVSPDPPLGVTWSLVEVVERYRADVEAVAEPPGQRARTLAESVEAGELARVSLDGGELHVLAVPPGQTASAVEEVVDDGGTRRRAARLGARRVEVRGADGTVAVRYLVE
jgi:hypothetical protein